MLRIANPPLVGSIPASASILNLLKTLLLILFVSFSCNAQAEEFSFGNQFIDAADRGNLPALEQLASGGYNINTQGEFGTTALMRAAFRGHKSIVEYLLRAGCDPDIQDMGGATALHIASREGHHEIVKLLMKESSFGELPDLEGYTPSMRAVLNEKPRSLKALLEYGVDISKSNDQGETTASLAKRSDNIEIKTIIAQATKEDDNEADDQFELQQVKDVHTDESTELNQTLEPQDINPNSESNVEVEKIESTDDSIANSHDALTELEQSKSTGSNENNKEIDVISSVNNFVSKNTLPEQGSIEVLVEDDSLDQYIRQKSSIKIAQAHEVVQINQISVSEPIKLPDDFDASKYQTLTAVDEETDKEHISAMVKGFSSEESLNKFWEKLSSNRNMNGFKINLYKNKSQVSDLVIKISYFANRSEVLEACKIVSDIDEKLICYASIE